MNWDTIRGAAAIATLAVTLIGGGYRIWADVASLKDDMTDVKTALRNLSCAVEPDTYACRFRLTGVIARGY